MVYQVNGSTLVNYVKENNLTAYEFCKKFGIKTATYNQILHNKKVPLTTLFVLSHKMNLSLNSFLA